MDYTRNEDRICNNNYRRGGVSYNQILGKPAKEAITTYPVTLAEAKNFCKIDIDEDDTLIEEVIIPAALDLCEDESNISFVQREITTQFNNRNGGTFLPLGPISGAVVIKDVDRTVISDGKFTTGEWQKLEYPRHTFIEATYTGGYEELPMKLKLALLNAIYYLYDNRAIAMDKIGPIASAILKPLSRV